MRAAGHGSRSGYAGHITASCDGLNALIMTQAGAGVCGAGLVRAAAGLHQVGAKGQGRSHRQHPCVDGGSYLG